MSRAGGIGARMAPRTSFNTSICGSQGASADGALICGLGSVRSAALRSASASACFFACSARAAFSFIDGAFPDAGHPVNAVSEGFVFLYI